MRDKIPLNLNRLFRMALRASVASCETKDPPAPQDAQVALQETASPLPRSAPHVGKRQNGRDGRQTEDSQPTHYEYNRKANYAAGCDVIGAPRRGFISDGRQSASATATRSIAGFSPNDNERLLEIQERTWGHFPTIKISANNSHFGISCYSHYLSIVYQHFSSRPCPILVFRLAERPFTLAERPFTLAGSRNTHSASTRLRIPMSRDENVMRKSSAGGISLSIGSVPNNHRWGLSPT